jgi:hypothetical protein
MLKWKGFGRKQPWSKSDTVPSVPWKVRGKPWTTQKSQSISAFLRLVCITAHWNRFVRPLAPLTVEWIYTKFNTGEFYRIWICMTNDAIYSFTPLNLIYAFEEYVLKVHNIIYIAYVFTSLCSVCVCVCDYYSQDQSSNTYCLFTQ